MRTQTLFFTLVLAMAAGCSGGSSGSKQVFYYNESTGIASLDPAFAKNQSVIWAVHQLYNTLVETDSQLHIVPSLARSWELSEDRLEYTFHLRTDVFFQDNPAFPQGRGRKLRAEDVVFSFSRLTNAATASPGAWIFNGRVDSLRPFRAPDDSTFILRLARPFSPMLGVLSNSYCSIIPEEALKKYGKDFRSHPCGTGPFYLANWEEGQAMILRKNPRYFEKDSSGKRLPYLDAVKISFYESKATEFLLFQQGRLDFINDIDPSFKDEVLTKSGKLRAEWLSRIILQKHPYLNTEYLGILMDTSNPLVKNSPLRLLQVRQAMNYGIDRRKMMLYLRNSIGIPAESGFIPAGLPGHDSSVVHGYHYDPEKARALLAGAGYGPDHPLPEIRLETIDIYSDMASYIARQLEDIGFRIQVDILPKGLLFEQTAKSNALFFRGSWIADYPDAENYLSVFYGRNPAPPNYTRFSNAQFDKWYEEALQLRDDSLRYKRYEDMDQLVISQSPVIPLWYDEVIHLVNPRVQGFVPNGLNLLELRHVTVQ